MERDPPPSLRFSPGGSGSRTNANTAPGGCQVQATRFPLCALPAIPQGSHYHFHSAGEEMEAQEVKRLAHGPTAHVSDRAGSEPVPRTAPPTQGSSSSAPAPLAPHPQAGHPRGPDVAVYHWLGVWFQSAPTKGHRETLEAQGFCVLSAARVPAPSTVSSMQPPTTKHPPLARRCFRRGFREGTTWRNSCRVGPTFLGGGGGGQRQTTQGP